MTKSKLLVGNYCMPKSMLSTLHATFHLILANSMIEVFQMRKQAQRSEVTLKVSGE